MRPSSVLNALHKHVPLIKFLGPRSKLNKGSINGNPKLHPAAPKGSTLPSQSLTRSDITTNASASNKSKSDSNAQTKETAGGVCCVMQAFNSIWRSAVLETPTSGIP
ncbi:9876_t:CDS:2 [Entrophospora sp. SA101]|nr:9876_t:CDS:2 [Entrophospora sp. SA101]CAJ0911954.1 11849_t:CDS:2 [Entrophospora sp. SA101]